MTSAKLNSSINHEKAVRHNIIKLAKRHRGASHPNTLKRIRIVWNPIQKTSTALRMKSGIVLMTYCVDQLQDNQFIGKETQFREDGVGTSGHDKRKKVRLLG